MIAPFWFATNGSPADWYSFLGRPRLPRPDPGSLEQLRGASILVTGAGGSIGLALSLKLATLCAKELVLLDSSEQALHRLQSALDSAALATGPRLLLGTVGDAVLLSEIFDLYEPELVFHAAAYKHVSLLEQHPLGAIANNALNTLTLAKCVQQKNGIRLVLLSSDKAVEPISILGATKRIAELITVAHQCVALRLGNVLGTEGSVSETFLRQIACGGPITITAPDALRYFLTCEEAVDLLLTSALEAPDGTILVPELERQYSIASLADFLVASFAQGRPIPIRQIGTRPGDKACEKLWSDEERPMRSKGRAYVELSRSIAYAHPESLAMDLGMLKAAVGKRDLVAAMDVVRRLVPEYEPSATLSSLLRLPVSGVVTS